MFFFISECEMHFCKYYIDGNIGKGGSIHASIFISEICAYFFSEILSFYSPLKKWCENLCVNCVSSGHMVRSKYANSNGGLVSIMLSF